MKILSIDVGIKNLAYCLVNFENNEISIDEWDVINICREKNTICGEKLKTKNTVCGKKAKFYKNEKYYCSVHSKNSEFLTPTNDIRLLKKKLLKKNAKISIKKLIEFCKNNNLEYIKIKKEYLIQNIITFLNTKYLNNVEKINANNLNMIQCGVLLKKHLDKTFKNTHIDRIIIENQIGPLALRMKMMQGMITQHFIENNLEKIELINASNKLKDFLKGKSTYNERKKLSVTITRNFLENEIKLNNWIDYFNKNSKKDDLADSYLQCLWYINHVVKNEK
jgi:hypothetical protein|tara:strand:+ start:49 stop:885 length:837 start_codon:yes stop_codon:yes gene_type:complete